LRIGVTWPGSREPANEEDLKPRKGAILGRRIKSVPHLNLWRGLRIRVVRLEQFLTAPLPD